jgi:hypothetical protein
LRQAVIMRRTAAFAVPVAGIAAALSAYVIHEAGRRNNDLSSAL